MEKTLSITSSGDLHTTTIEIDNSTEFKDFNITQTLNDAALAPDRAIQIQLSDEGVKIGNIKLTGTNKDLLLKLLNQSS